MEHHCTPPVPSNDPLARDPSVKKSLTRRRDYLLIGSSIVGGIALSASICVPERVFLPFRVDLGAHALRLALPLAVFPLMVALVAINTVLTPWRLGLERQWLRKLPFPFAHRGYLTVLKRDPGNNALQLLLTFDHEPPQKEFEQMCKSRVRGSKLVWQDESCVMVQSPAAATHSGTFSRGTYSNAQLHRWFRKVAAPFLGDLHRKAGLKKVELRS